MPATTSCLAPSSRTGRTFLWTNKNGVSICIKGKVHIFKYLSIEACRSEKMPDSLYLPVMERLSFTRPSTGSVEDMEQQKKQDSDSGVGSDNGDKRLSATESFSETHTVVLVLAINSSSQSSILEKRAFKQKKRSTLSQTAYCKVEMVQRSLHSGQCLMEVACHVTGAAGANLCLCTQGRTAAAFEEPLRIEEDSHWQTEQTSKVSGGTQLHINMINQLQEAVELLQNPSSTEQDDLSEVQLYPVEMVTVEESF
ncbi:hypothetical protein GOODEAATRI_004747, partial [Goodea atripinnis]